MKARARRFCLICETRIFTVISLKGKLWENFTMKQKGKIKDTICSDCYRKMKYDVLHPKNNVEPDFQKIMDYIEKNHGKPGLYNKRLS